ncbi:MAG: Ig-like domain-containing protein [Bacteroidetes bacterium]|nr:Ig-like domain-containing protein [Bacteroidota bacterium]MCL2302890.1 Ig-like domain-containing protein [Lentimicrobiaceae bacterium]
MKRNFLKPMTVAVLLLTFCVSFSSCKKWVTDLTLNKSELTLAPGETETLIATLYPNNATDKTINWTSTNPAVATVNSNGVVTALSAGHVYIIASNHNNYITAWCRTVVHPANYFGDWDFVVKRFWRDHYEIDGWASDTVYYSGKIEIGSSYLSFLIEYMENTTLLEVWISESGGLLSFSLPRYEGIKGNFEGSNKVYIERGFEHGSEFTPFHIINGTKRE